MKTVGIVGGIGPESTIDYYHAIINRYMTVGHTQYYPHIVIDSVDLTRMVGLLEANNLEGLATALVESLDLLARAGADFAVFAANTPHLVFDQVEAVSPLPLVSIVEETRKKAAALGYSTLGLLGTRFTMQSGFFQKVFSRHGMKILVPDESEHELIHDRYMNQLVHGQFLEETKQEFLRIASDLEKRGIEGLILGGTELPLLLKAEDAAGVPFLNPSEIHVERIVEMLL
jgi:aspartate racemase